MVLYNPNLNENLGDFGITIPALAAKYSKTFDYLMNIPLLNKTRGKWHISELFCETSRKDLLRVHTERYVHNLYDGDVDKEVIRAYELVNEKGKYHRYSPQQARYPLKNLFNYALLACSALYQSALAALDKGFCFFLGGGMHHVHADYGKGFGLLNDIVITSRKLLAEGKVKKIWVIDVDCHKGDGTADLTQNDALIITLSIHMAKGWPLHDESYDKEGNFNPSFAPSNIDIDIQEGEERLYNTKLQAGLDKLPPFGMPDLAIVVDGVDPYEKDELLSASLIRLTKEEMQERDKLVFNFLKKHHIPAVYVAAGGYGKHSWEIYSQFLQWVLVEQFKN